MTELNVVQGDSGYPLSFTLKQSDGTALDLTGTTLLFKAQVLNTQAVKFSRAMVIDTANLGTCHVQIQATDFDVEGRYAGEITVTYPSTETLSFVDILVVAAPKLPRV